MELTFKLMSLKLGERADRWPAFATVRVQPSEPIPAALSESRFIDITFKLPRSPAPEGIAAIEAAALESARGLVHVTAAAALLQAMAA